jgi:phospholipid/cholesterol/gamma-HCH transport system substrate-binding protein
MRRGAGIAGNPVLIGAATILVVLVAVFLAYNANKGLPFVPTYELKAQVPSAANLVVGNDVRIGGSRVGFVSEINAERRDDGSTIAVLTLTLEKSVAPLPRDSTLIIRPRSALGLKYVELTRGTDARGYADGATIPIAAATPRPVEFDEVLSMFDEKTRQAAADNTTGFGDAFAGRGESINTAIGAFRPLLRDIVPVAKNLASPDTNLQRFIAALGRTAAIVAPAAEQQAELFVNLDTTFAALRDVNPFIQESITEGVPALDAAIRSFPIQRPFLRNTELLMHELRPGAAALRQFAPTIADALAEGIKVLPRTPPFNEQLASLLEELERFAEDPQVPRGLRATTTALNELQPTLHFVTPAQTQCNYVTLFFRNVASHLSEGDTKNGTWQRFIIVPTPQGPNNEGSPSSAPANGPTDANRLRSNPYPHTAAPGQPRECEAGNEPFDPSRSVIGNPAGTQSDRTEVTRP